MRRQHPDKPDLFWCPKCKTYKKEECFYPRSYQKNACRDCIQLSRHKYKCVCAYCGAEIITFKGAKFCSKICADDSRRGSHFNNSGQFQKGVVPINKKYIGGNKEKKHIGLLELHNWYIFDLLRREGIINPSTELIELKRQQLRLYREIKQIKQEVANGIT